MLLRNISARLLTIALVSGILTVFAGCSSFIWEEQPDCPAQLSLRFVYDYNIKFADAFAREVKSVNVWAFDRSGRLVWSEAVAGEPLATGNFTIDTPLAEGTYDIVTWCGLRDNDAFELASYSPQSREDLEVKLRTIDEHGLTSCGSHLAGLFHALNAGVEFVADPYAPTYHTETLSLMKDTKDIRIMLQHLDGSEIDSRDFSVTITCRDAWLDWENQLHPEGPTVTYTPWNVRYGQVEAPGEPDKGQNGSRTVTTVASLLFDLSTSRLMADEGAVLTVRRNTDGEDIIRIPLTDYFLLVKGHYGDMGDQEYLDRQDDYSAVFFLDKNSNWYTAGGIYINNWAVVPPQHEEM